VVENASFSGGNRHRKRQIHSAETATTGHGAETTTTSISWVGARTQSVSNGQSDVIPLLPPRRLLSRHTSRRPSRTVGV
jgi:hypothetical protein